jgi:hypothetical protein
MTTNSYTNIPFAVTYQDVIHNYFTQKAVYDVAFYYAPYVPLSPVSVTTTLENKSVEPIYNNLTYCFASYHTTNDNVIEWLMNDCNWSYDLFSLVDGSFQSYVVFDDIRGSIEFKLRWVNV